MAAEEAKVVDAMPPPPAYYKLFAPDAATVATTTASASSIRTESDPSSPAVPSSLPEDADDGFPLKPPPPPGPEETFKMFGMPYSTNPVPEELLPPEKMVVPTSGQQTNFRAEMKTLLNSIMANYGQFMEMLICSPSRAHEKVSDLETLFVNFHSLLNRYRAHQARHIILERLRSQVAENVAAISVLEGAMRKSILARERASACLRAPNGTLAAIGVPMDVSDGDVPRESWREMEELDGALAVGGVIAQGHAQAQWPVSLTGNGHEMGSMVDENLRGGGGSIR